MAPSTPSCRCSRSSGRSASVTWLPRPTAGTTPRCTSVTSSAVSCERREGLVDAGQERVEFLRASPSRRRRRRASAPCQVPMASRPCHGSANSRRPSAVGAPHATAGAGRRVTRFMALTSRGDCRTPKPPISRPALAPVALSSTRALMVSIGAVDVVARDHAGNRPALPNRLDGIHVVGQDRAGAHGGDGHGKRETFGVRRAVVVPHADGPVAEQRRRCRARPAPRRRRCGLRAGAGDRGTPALRPGVSAASRAKPGAEQARRLAVRCRRPARQTPGARSSAGPCAPTCAARAPTAAAAAGSTDCR